MKITQKNPFKEDFFVDRKTCLRNFNEAVINLREKKYSVLAYYGVAGIGKTSLRKEFPKLLAEYNLKYQQQEVIWASIDLQLEKHREKNTFLITLKNELQKKYKINFPAFEIAHAIYWKKANPEIPLRKENYVLFEGDDAFDDFFGVINQVPYFQVIPATARLLKSAPDHLRKWWTKKREAQLSQLSEKEPLEIEELLPYFWAQDLNNYLEHTSKTAVFFIDTYEALWENHRDEGNFRDEWIREELITRLPRNALWVFCGREALRWKEINDKWSEYLTQYEVKKLFRKYCMEYLETRGITDTEIQEAIFNGSKGVPYYLELSADTYEKILENDEKPKPEDFGKTHQEIANRFFRYLSYEEKNSLNVLSIPRFWDYDLFNYLIKEFNTGYSTNNYENLCCFSFIGKAENNKQQMHQLMQDCLQRTQLKERPDSVKRIHKAIQKYYDNRLNNIDIKEITSEHEIALAEAFYHAKEALEAKDLLNWFVTVSDSFNKAAFWQLIAPLYEELLQDLEDNLEPAHPDIATTLNNLASIYRHQGTYEKALPLFGRALEIREKVPIPEHLDIATTLNSLAALYTNMGDYDEALLFIQRALVIREKVLGPQHITVAATLSDLAALYYYKGDYDKALPLYQKALEIQEKARGPEHQDVATTLNNLAGLYGHIGDYDKALSLYQRGLEIQEKALGPEHPDVATTLNNLALLYTNMRDFNKALPLFQRALYIREKVLGPQHTHFATTLNNLAILYTENGDYDKAFSLFQRALYIREKALGPQHTEVATILNNLALVYEYKGDYDKALPLFKRALKIRKKFLGPQHKLFSQSLNNLAGLYDKMGYQEKAMSLYQRIERSSK
jgi:tetratricopeptide (TPR) repeat protein